MKMLTPQSEAELAEMLAGASGPLCVQGGGTRGLAIDGEGLSTRGLSGVELYEPGALTLVVRAGTPVAEVEALLAAENQQLAFEPMDHRGLLGTEGEPTIGGVIAAGVSGPRRIQSGAARDHLLGVRFVDGSGQAVKNGGRVMKNVTGYDLVKLMCGAHGTLGVLSEVSMKVLPRAEASATVAIEGADLAAAVAAMSAALGSPYDVTGAAYDPEKQTAFVRVEGFADSAAYRCRKLVSELGGFGSPQIESEDAGLWQGIRDGAGFHGRAGDVWRISVRPSDAVALAPRLQAEVLQFDWGGGLIWALVPAGTDLRARIGVPGHATLVRACADTRKRLGVFQPQPGPLAAISEGLRRQFDPKELLNPGLMG
ncbi:FAD-binding protein [Leisingera sp. HS039]|uniref:FAD-binding protein n=1 Tax=unclassified Leisingera TaxID=2614906 RepID=UPI00142FB390|nr:MULTISPECIES: FAD-binding protein [unclassified Leisingera]MBQ4826093.1 FAD-binding protein [Leisingera sp. HS039]